MGQLALGRHFPPMKDDKIVALKEVSKFLLDNPELAFKEYKAHDVCISFLKKHCLDWKITLHAYGLETAWEAVYSQGEGGRRIVYCSEYDALPDVGHACIQGLCLAKNRWSQPHMRRWHCRRVGNSRETQGESRSSRSSSSARYSSRGRFGLLNS